MFGVGRGSRAVVFAERMHSRRIAPLVPILVHRGRVQCTERAGTGMRGYKFLDDPCARSKPAETSRSATPSPPIFRDDEARRLAGSDVPAMSLRSACNEPRPEAGLVLCVFARCCDTDGRLTLKHQTIFEQLQHHRLKVLGDCEPGVLKYDLVLLGQFMSKLPGP